LFEWNGWSKVAPIATGLTAVAALYFSAQSLRSTQNQYVLSEKGQLSDRFSRSIDQLGSEKPDVRLGGIYSLEQVARDSSADRTVVFEVLAAYVRTHVHATNAPATSFFLFKGCPQPPPPLPPPVDLQVNPPPGDIQATLTVIGRRGPPRSDQEVIDLSGACLREADMHHAYLENAQLSHTDFSRASLSGASLASAFMLGDDLDEADLSQSNMTDAVLESASLVDADLSEANLTGAILDNADLTGAKLTGAKLTDISYSESTRWPEGFNPPASHSPFK
jgi:hypothetical protein